MPHALMRARHLWFLLLALGVGCGSSGEDATDRADVRDAAAATTDTESSTSDAPTVPDTDGPAVDSRLDPATCSVDMGSEDVPVLLRVTAKIDGEWRQPEGPCTAEGSTLVGSTTGGVLAVETVGTGVRAEFDATGAAQVEALELRATVRLEGADRWISNGFQSWSQSGVIAIDDAPDAEALDAALRRIGDAEVARTGRELSWQYTVVGGGELSLLLGARTSARLKPWVQVARGDAPGTIDVRLGSGGTGERINAVPGDAVVGETFEVVAGSDTAGLMRSHGESLRTRPLAHADAGWNSWYELWDSVDEEAVRANAARAVELLAPRMPAGAPPLRVVIDDGWQRAWGDWTANEKFPSGLAGLAADLKGDGLAAGIWLAPLLAHEESAVAAAHPDWFVPEIAFAHPVHGDMHVLDVTHPDAAEHLKGVIRTVVEAGYDLLKIDFLFAGTWEGARHEPVTGMEAYTRALALIREAAGEDVLLLAVGAPALPTLDFADSWRSGGDIATPLFDAVWPFLPNQARSLAARWPICFATLCDADPPLLRTLPRHEVEAGAWIVAFAGGALFLSDDLRDLDDERADWALTEDVVVRSLAGSPMWPEQPLGGEPPALLTNPIVDLGTGRDTHVVPLVWTDGEGLRVALNVGGDPVDADGEVVPPHSARLLPPGSGP